MRARIHSACSQPHRPGGAGSAAPGIFFAAHSGPLTTKLSVVEMPREPADHAVPRLLMAPSSRRTCLGTKLPSPQMGRLERDSELSGLHRPQPARRTVLGPAVEPEGGWEQAVQGQLCSRLPDVIPPNMKPNLREMFPGCRWIRATEHSEFSVNKVRPARRWQGLTSGGH